MEQARRAIRWEIILVIAASLGVSTGMETSGASGKRSMLLLRLHHLHAALLPPHPQWSHHPATPLTARPTAHGVPAAAIANGLVSIGRKAGGQGFIIIGESCTRRTLLWHARGGMLCYRKLG